MKTTFKNLLVLGCFTVLCTTHTAVLASNPDVTYVLESRAQTLTGAKCGWPEYTNCCPPLIRYYFTEETWNFIELMYSMFPDCSDPYWIGTYYDHSKSVFSGLNCTNYDWPVCEGVYTWSVTGQGGYSDFGTRDCGGWWVNNGGYPFYTNDIGGLTYVWFWENGSCQYSFWQGGTVTGVKTCTATLQTNIFPSCSVSSCLVYYLAGTNRSIAYLTNEFTTLHLITNTLEMTLTNDWSPCGRESQHASLWLSENEVQGVRDLAEVRFKVLCSANERFSIDYLLCRQWLSNGVPVVTKTKSKLKGAGTGAWQYLTVDLPIPYTTWTSNGCLYYRGESTWIEAPCAGGSSCASGQCGEYPGSASASLTDAGLFVATSLGPAAYARGSSSLTLAANSPAAELTTPAALQFSGDATGAILLRSGGALRQVRNAGGTCLADIQATSATSFAIRFYDSDGGLVNGLYDVSAYEPFSTVTVAQGTSAAQFLVTIDTGTASQYTYDWSDADKAWTLTSGGGLRKETRSWDQTLLVRTNTIRNASDQILYQEAEHYTNLPNYGLVLIRHVVGPLGPALTTQYSYYDNPGADGTNYGSVKMVVQPTGFWQRYEYDSLARVTKEIFQFLNAPTNAAENECRVVQYDYTPLDGNTAETRIEKLLGSEISRQYTIEYPSANRSIRCATPGAPWTAADNLATLATSYAEGPFAGRTQSVRNPDGTLQLYSYQFLNFGAEEETAVLSGAPNGTWTDVTNGTKIVTLVAATGEVLPSTTYDILLGDFHGMGEGSFNFDSLGRRYFAYYPDNTIELINFSCCGIDSIIDRKGVTTTHLYDGLKRQIGTVRNGITTTNLIDAVGNILATVRIGTDGSAITNHQAVYDVAGRLTFETNALGGWTSYSETKDGSGQTIKTITYPDRGTRIETYYQDGSLLKVTGTASFPVRYEYGIENDGTGLTSPFTKEIKLDSAYADTHEWTKTYTDMVGRAYKTVYSAPSAPFPVRQSFFNHLGQLYKEVDPDGVTSLYQYNPKGELEYTAVDMDADDELDFAGTDRITRTVSEFVLKDNYPWRATSTYVWAQNGVDSPVLESLTMSSAEGLSSLTVAQGLTNTTEIVNEWYSGLRTITTFAPDGTQRAQSRTRYGTNVYSVVWDSLRRFVSEVYFACDPHGRQNQVAERRADYSLATNIAFFNNADQASGLLSPAPAEGQGPQVTTNFFDNMGRIWRTQLPDATSLTNEFYPNGLLKKTYGSRTYPVEYTYDAQGRMKSMKTWQNFAANSGTATTTWNYNTNRGWLESKLCADGQGPIYTNTPGGRLKSRTWARGITTTYNYNNAGDLNTLVYSDGSAGITYGLDRRGRRTSVTQGGIVQTLTLDEAGLLRSESFSGGPLDGLSVTNGYDELLRRTNLVVLKSSNPIIQQSFTFDPASRLETVTEGANSATYSYVAYSSLIGQIDFSHDSQPVMSTIKQYDGLNRLTNITTLDTSQLLLDSHLYGYNAANQRTNHVLNDNSFWLYTYDGLGQVTSGRKYWPNGTPVAGLQFTYGFDDIGNRKTAGSGGDQYGGNLHFQNYSANSLNQYTTRTVPGFADVTGSANSNATVTVWADNGAAAGSIRQGEHFYAALPVNNPTGAVWLTLTNIAVLKDGANPDIVTNTTGKALMAKTPELFTYDLDGNLTSDGLWTNNWNAENRRTNVESPSTVPTPARAREQWTYLPDGRWIERIVSSWNASAWVPQYTNRYLWDGQVLMGVLDQTNGVVLSFMRGLDLSGSTQGAGGVGGLLAVSQFANSQMSNSHFACFDGTGNVMALVAAGDGSISAEYEYGPFGEAIRATGPIAQTNPIRFSTQYADDVTGDLEYLFRAYSSTFGRWNTRDPVGERSDLGLYSFTRNQLAIDRLGLATLNYIDFPKWQVAKGWDDQYATEFLWAGHYITLDALDASLLEGRGVMLVNHRSQASIADCKTPENEKLLQSRNWYFANRFDVDANGNVQAADNFESFGRRGTAPVVGNYLFTQIANFGLGMPALLRKYGGQSTRPGHTKGWLSSRMEIHIIPATGYDITTEAWERPPTPDGWWGWGQVGIEGHEHSRGHYGRIADGMPMSFTASSVYSVTISLDFKWDDCCGVAKWDFRCSPQIGSQGLQRWRYRDASDVAVNLLMQPNSGNW